MRQNRVTQSSNRILIQFDGREVGAVQSVSARDDYGLEPQSGIGDAHAHEYVPGMARHTLDVEHMVLFKNNLRQLGIFAENADAVLQGNVFDIVVVSKDTGETLRKYIGCSYASGSLDVRKHSIVVSRGTFMALDVSGTGA